MKNRFTFFIYAFAFFFSGILFAQVTITEEKITQNTELNKGKVLQADIVTFIEGDTGAIFLKSDIQNVEVYINYEFYGRTNLFVDKLIPGVYAIKLVKAGYYDFLSSIEVTAGEQKTFFFDLEAMKGMLAFDVDQKSAKILVDEKAVIGNAIYLPEGTYTVEISLFGFKTIRTNVSVTHSIKRTVSAKMEKAEFTVRNFQAEPKAFNPDNAGNLGKAKITFWVSTRGSATLTIRSKDGQTHAVYQFPPFTTWNQSYTWSGKTSAGSSLPEGEYDLELSIVAADDPQIHTLQQLVTIDKKITYPFFSVSANGAGVGLVSSSQLYPKNTLYSSFSVLPVFAMEGFKFFSAPILISVLGTPLPFLELFGSFAII
ncbi:MAG: PEGA domain-containing protein, partial [Treponemataceae bacterium]